MAILDTQRRLAEVGRIRIGQVVETNNGKTRPVKLDTLRLTSPDRRRIEQAAELYGGTVQPWQAPAGQQWEVVTDTADVPVIVPPSDMAFSQWYELWSRAGCQRRCDGVTEQLSDGPCVCDPEQRDCKPHSRLSVMLRDLRGLGLWRVDTQGYYAMHELAGAVELIHMAAGQGALVPARLRVEQRQVVRQGQDGSPETYKFPVPVVDLEMTGGELVQGIPQAMGLQPGAGGQPSGLGDGGERRAVPADTSPDPGPEVPAEVPLTPVPAANQQHAPAAPVADQIAENDERGSRRRSQVPIPDPGLPEEDGEHDGLLAQVEQLIGECEQAGADVDVAKAREFAQSTVPNARRAIESLQSRLDAAQAEQADEEADGEASAASWPAKLGKHEYAWLREVGVDDDMRPQLVAAITDGQTRSSRDLGEQQVPALLAAATAWSQRLVSIVPEGPDGWPVLMWPSGELVDPAQLPGEVQPPVMNGDGESTEADAADEEAAQQELGGETADG